MAHSQNLFYINTQYVRMREHIHVHLYMHIMEMEDSGNSIGSHYETSTPFLLVLFCRISNRIDRFCGSCFIRLKKKSQASLFMF